MGYMWVTGHLGKLSGTGLGFKIPQADVLRMVGRGPSGGTDVPRKGPYAGGFPMLWHTVPPGCGWGQKGYRMGTDRPVIGGRVMGHLGAQKGTGMGSVPWRFPGL